MPATARFLSHVLPKGFHRIRYYGLFASSNRTANIARVRQLLGAAPRVVEPEEEKAAASDQPRVLPCPCPRCGGRMIVIGVFRTRLRADLSANVCSDADQDRHLMTAARIARRKAAVAHVGHQPAAIPLAHVALHPSSKATTKQRLDPLSGPPKTPAYPPTGRPSQLLHPKPTIVTMPLEPNSP